MNGPGLWHTIGAWRDRRRARRREQRRQSHQRQLLLWGGPVEAGRVLAPNALSFLILGQLWLAHHRIFGVIARVDYVVLRRNLVFLGLIAIMPFPVRLLSDYNKRPLAVAIYAAAFIAAMALQLLLWRDMTRPERRELLIEPVPAEVRAGFARTLGGMLLVFGAIMPAGMLAPRYAALVWALMIPLRLVVARFAHLTGQGSYS
jgi:uncharacterized membrane protein